MDAPRVSIGLPVYNGERYIALALQSILTQDFTDFELIISDNASRDRTDAICQQFSECDPRVRYSRVDVNRGAAPNYQRVFQLARGKYFKWAAYDDVCLPGFLKRCVETIEQAPSSVVLVYPRAETIDADGQVTGMDSESVTSQDPRPYRRALRVVQNVNLAWAMFGLMRSDTLKKTRLIDRFIGSDYVFLTELAMLGWLLEMPEVLFQRRVHPEMSNVVHKSRSQWLTWMDSAQTGRKVPFPPWVRIGWECVGSINRLPLTRREKLLCQFAVPSAWYLRNLRNLGGRYKRRLKQALELHMAVL